MRRLICFTLFLCWVGLPAGARATSVGYPLVGPVLTFPGPDDTAVPANTWIWLSEQQPTSFDLRFETPDPDGDGPETGHGALTLVDGAGGRVPIRVVPGPSSLVFLVPEAPLTVGQRYEVHASNPELASRHDPSVEVDPDTIRLGEFTVTDEVDLTPPSPPELREVKHRRPFLGRHWTDCFFDHDGDRLVAQETRTGLAPSVFDEDTVMSFRLSETDQVRVPAGQSGMELHVAAIDTAGNVSDFVDPIALGCTTAGGTGAGGAFVALLILPLVGGRASRGRKLDP